MPDQSELRAPLLDRLVDIGPACRLSPHGTGTLRTIKESVLRDMENLFNTRSFLHPGSDSRHVETSVLIYGARDFISMNPLSQRTRLCVREEIERLLNLFEPRLRNVAVRFDSTMEEKRTLNFRIEAVMRVASTVTPITVETRFDINRGSYAISE